MPPILIHVTLDGKDYGMRRWSAVPRVDEIMIVSVKGEGREARVTHVVWGVTPQSRENGDAEVEVACKLMKPR